MNQINAASLPNDGLFSGKEDITGAIFDHAQPMEMEMELA